MSDVRPSQHKKKKHKRRRAVGYVYIVALWLQELIFSNFRYSHTVLVSVIFVLTYFLVLVAVLEIFFSFSFVLVFIIFSF